MQIDPNGFCRQPYKYHLVVQRSGNLTGYDANGSFGTGLIFNSIASEFKSSNLSSCFNTANGLFTAPVTGIYLLEASAYAPGQTFSQGWFTINSARSAYSDWVKGQAGHIVNCINMVKLSATNTVGFHPHGGGGQSSITINADANHTWMRITFIG